MSCPDSSAASATGRLFVVAAPSGAGKSSLVAALMRTDAGVQASVSHTTRAARGQEQHGREYFFVSHEAFERMVAAGDFLEWARVHGNCYGTSRQAVEQRLASGGDVLLEIDWQGALQIRRLFAQSVLVFILPPGMDALRQRLIARGEDGMETIAQRLHNAAEEMAHAAQFDYVIINDVFERALSDLQAIVRTQRLTYTAQRRARADVFAALHITPTE